MFRTWHPFTRVFVPLQELKMVFFTFWASEAYKLDKILHWQGTLSGKRLLNQSQYIIAFPLHQSARTLQYRMTV